MKPYKHVPKITTEKRTPKTLKIPPRQQKINNIFNHIYGTRHASFLAAARLQHFINIQQQQPKGSLRSIASMCKCDTFFCALFVTGSAEWHHTTRQPLRDHMRVDAAILIIYRCRMACDVDGPLGVYASQPKGIDQRLHAHTIIRTIPRR